MPSFTLSTDGYRYRPLKQGVTPAWDVYGLQCALNETGYPCGAADGYFGPKTDAATRGFQQAAALAVDGIAGVVTQRALTLRLVYPVQQEYRLPAGLLKGQIESESAFWLGNHSIRYDDASFDIGVTQRNTRYLPNREEGFDPAHSIDFLGKTLRERYVEYKGYGKVTDERRLWELASGSWNRPAWTQTLAKGGKLTTSQSDWIERYISRTTAYMVV